MRDAFGASYFIKFALVFIAIFASMLAIALNYAKAFRIKNQIINYIEVNNGLSESLKKDIENYVASMDYYVQNVNPGSNVSSVREYNFTNTCNKRGYCIYRVSSDTLKGEYYKVVTFIHIEFPFFGINLNVPITGETKLVSGKYVK